MNEKLLLTECLKVPSKDLEAVVVLRATELGRYLASKQAMITTAESCTGGAIARALTETAGSSAWFDRAYITYSNSAKAELLGVPQAVLAEHGAVSEAVVQVMAAQALERSKAHLALAVSGVAGPGGGSIDKPVGTVCFAWATRAPFEAKCFVRRFHFEGDRHAVRLRTALVSLAIGQALSID